MNPMLSPINSDPKKFPNQKNQQKTYTRRNLMAGDSDYSKRLVYLTTSVLLTSFISPFALKSQIKAHGMGLLYLIEAPLLFGILFLQKTLKLIQLHQKNEEIYLAGYKFTLTRVTWFILIEYFLGKLAFLTVSYVLSNPTTANSAICLYYLILVFYHNGEFIFVATCHYDLLTYDSFLTYHSAAYQIAQWTGVLEFLVESYFFPDYKTHGIEIRLIFFGALMAAGMACRMSAFYYANVSFTHIVSTIKKQEHVLVTNGIYQFIRHPSYFGYF
jgi:protein-S-isoprenylcysteine O-methyltransferase Ste14